MTATTTAYHPSSTRPDEASLRMLDAIGFIVAVIITLGPLAATALMHP